MKKMLFLLLPICIWAQDYYEASGKTRIFTLAPGSKGTWESSAVEQNQSEQLGFTNMKVFPNPCNGIVNILVSNANRSVSVAIYNIAGEKVQQIGFNQRQHATINNMLPNGIYFARLHENGHMIQTRRFMVVR